jgi:DNA polymerase-4
MLLRAEEAAARLEALPVDKLCGIGPSTGRRLSALGITTCGELGRAPLKLLVHHFGILGHRLRDMGRGIDHSPVAMAEEEPAARSVGHSMTLERNVSDRRSLEAILLQLSEGVGRRLRRNRLSGRVVALTLRYADFTTFTRQKRIEQNIDDDPGIYRVARNILSAQRLAQPVRLLGVSVSDLTPDAGQVPLFPEDRRRKDLLSAMDCINDRHGARTLCWGTLLQRDPHRPVISPAWRPRGSKEHC